MAHELERTIQEMPFHNIETVVFLSGWELLEHYTISDGYHIVLLDIEIPAINGIETAVRLREMDSNVILIFVTAYKEYVYQIFNTLPFRFLEKPVSDEKISEVMRDAICQIEEMKCYFLQIHTSYIVNMDYITSFHEKSVLLLNDISLPVSLKYRENACLEHLKYLERRCGTW